MKVLSQAQLTKELSAIGIYHSDVLMVHASLRKLGPVEGRAAGVIEALQNTLGPKGHLVMVIASDDDDPFDYLESEVDVEDMGVLCEVFRTTQNVEVNDHPAARFAAWGPEATDILNPAPLHDYYGPGSVLERLLERGVKVLRLGADIDTVTLTHYAEYLAEVPNKKRVTRRYELAAADPVDVHSLDDTLGIVEWPRGDYFSHILQDYLKAGHAKVSKVGDCQAELLPGKHFVEFALEWMNRELGASAPWRKTSTP